MAVIREITESDFDSLMRLYMQLHNNPFPEHTNYVESMMLLTGSKEESTLNFYRKCGYNSENKTAFIQWL